MNLFVLAWLLAGSIAYALHRRSATPAKPKTGNDLLLLVGGLSLLCAVAARLLVVSAHGVIWLMERLAICSGASSAPDFVTPLRSLWHLFSPIEYSFTWIVSLCVAGAFGHWDWLRRWLKSWGLYDEQDGDPYHWICERLVGKQNTLALISTKIGKVYVGTLGKATRDPNETARFILLAPTMSGSRHKETQRVTFDTYYQEDPPRGEPVSMLISVSEIVSIAEFDQTLHDKFVAQGICGMRIPTEDSSEADKTSPKS
jgi:hypothetical protein